MRETPASEEVSDFLAALQPRVAGDLRADIYTRTLYLSLIHI